MGHAASRSPDHLAVSVHTVAPRERQVAPARRVQPHGHRLIGEIRVGPAALADELEIPAGVLGLGLGVEDVLRAARQELCSPMASALFADGWALNIMS